MALAATKDAPGFHEAIEYGLFCLERGSLSLKSEQIEAVRHIYNGKDVFLCLPTGFGKSICYEIVPFIMDYKLGRRESGRRSFSTVLVVSPLISLMVDQVTSLRERGVTAGIISSQSSIPGELTVRVSNIHQYSILFCAPEAVIGVDKWRERLSNTSMSDIVAVAVDEAHCVSKW